MNAMIGGTVTMPAPVRLADLIRQSREARGLYANYISHQLRYLALSARFPRPVNVHLLRHSHVTIMADAGVPYETIQLSTGHASTAMLRIYDRRNPARLRAALKTVFG